MINVAINGFGRIGRCLTRLIFNEFHDHIKLTHINSRGMDPEYMAYLFQYDTAHKKFNLPVSYNQSSIIINHQKIKTTQFNNEDDFNWDNIDIVFECTGSQNNLKGGNNHLKRGAKKVIITAPTSKDIPMFIIGTNETEYKNQTIISASSCTTNCLAPVIKTIHQYYPIQKALMTTIHAFTNSQNLVDSTSHKDWRSGRAGAHNIIPSSTGAASAIGDIIPDLKGKITGSAIRVPTITGSLVDISIQFEKPTSLQQIFQTINSNNRKDILKTTKKPIVSSDVIGNICCSIVDEKASLQLDPTFLKLSIWYDNEIGYSYRTLLLALYIYQPSIANSFIPHQVSIFNNSLNITL